MTDSGNANVTESPIEPCGPGTAFKPYVACVRAIHSVNFQHASFSLGYVVPRTPCERDVPLMTPEDLEIAGSCL